MAKWGSSYNCCHQQDPVGLTGTQKTTLVTQIFVGQTCFLESGDLEAKFAALCDCSICYSIAETAVKAAASSPRPHQDLRRLRSTRLQAS